MLCNCGQLTVITVLRLRRTALGPWYRELWWMFGELWAVLLQTFPQDILRDTRAWVRDFSRGVGESWSAHARFYACAFFGLYLLGLFGAHTYRPTVVAAGLCTLSLYRTAWGLRHPWLSFVAYITFAAFAAIILS